MNHYGQEVLIKDAIVFLLAAGLIVPIMRVVKIPTILGFIVAGIALGPYGLGSVARHAEWLTYVSFSEPESTKIFAELGVLFLLFLIGLELSFKKLWSLRTFVFGVGTVQVGASTLVIAAAAAWAGLTAPVAILLGLALALSSTAIVMHLLIEGRRASTPTGRAALGVLLLQDILVAPILIYIGFMSRESGGDQITMVITALVEALVALGLILFIGRFVLRRWFRLAAMTGGRDFLFAMSLLTVVGGAVITASAGLSLALGAFLVGVLVGETEFKHQIEVDLEPFKSLLLGLFFMTVGMDLNLVQVADKLPVILLGLAGLLAAKTLIAFVACRLFIKDNQASVETAFLLGPSGEFAFVILGAATVGGLVSVEHAAIVAAIVGLSMMVMPLMSFAGQKLGALAVENDQDSDQQTAADYSDRQGHVLITGFGRVGQAIGRVLETENTELLVLERSPALAAHMREQGWTVYLGDASRPELLERAGIAGAAMLILTLDDAGNAESAVRIARSLRADLPIIARARDSGHARDLYKAGATFVVPETIEAGLQMSARALEEIGYDKETARKHVALERAKEYEIANIAAEKE